MRSKLIGSFSAVSALLIVILGTLSVSTAGPTDYQAMAIGSLVVSIICYVAVYVAWGRDFLCGPTIYLTLFSVFHLGLVWTLGFSGEGSVLAVSPLAGSWFRTSLLTHAVWLCCLAIIIFSVVAVVMRPRHERHVVLPTDREQRSSRRIGRSGLALELGGLTVLMATVISNGGLGLVTGGYIQFLESAQTSSFAYSIWLIGTGACLSQVGTRSIRRMGLLAFCLFAVIFFPIGLRGSVLFPGMVLLATCALTGRRFRTVYLGVGAAAALELAAVVRLSRVGLESSQSFSWYSPMVSTVTELGFSIRPTIEVLDWERMGRSHTMFVSFFAVPIRILEKYAGWHGGPPPLDERLFNVKVNTLVGPIGGSPVAEAFDAFGTFGVVLVLTLLAIAICYVSKPRSARSVDVGKFVVVMIPLVVAVRNSFAPVIVQLSLGLLILFVCQLPSRHAISRQTVAVPVAT